MASVLGFLNIDKPQGVTSHDVVAKVRRGFGVKKIGHAGTLDPMATGVLILCLGGATRLSEYVMQSTKQYRAGIRLGVTTDTYDAEGEVQSVRDASSIAFADVENALEGFRGDIQQVPPMYSAIKQGGRKLYDIARAGETVAREPRAVTIESLEVVDWKLPELTVDVRCTAGTYIRSLAYDLGEVLGVGAHLTALTRLASGSFQLENAVSLDELLSTADWQNRIIPPSVALSGWSTVHLGLDEVEHIQQGRAIPYSHRIEGLAFAYAPDGSLVAIVEMRNSLLHPHKVFS